MQSFAQNLILRPSCYDCKFKKKHRCSDITLADFWGVWNIAPEMYNQTGTSLVVLNSTKGERIFNEISSEAVVKEVGFEEAIKHNSSMYYSAHKPEKRKDFFDELSRKNFLSASKLFCNNNNFYRKLLSRIKRYIVH